MADHNRMDKLMLSSNMMASVAEMQALLQAQSAPNKPKALQESGIAAPAGAEPPHAAAVGIAATDHYSQGAAASVSDAKAPAAALVRFPSQRIGQMPGEHMLCF